MAGRAQIPRLLIGAVASGSGKTTVAVGLILALRARGLRVAPFKCGPDYLDPSYHARAAARTSHNLDAWMMGREAVVTTFTRTTADADVAIIEGMMGLFDGTTPLADEGSTAQIAKWLQAPVLLVVDASGMARTVGALAHGFNHFDPSLTVAGLICNRVGSRGHLELLRQASGEVPLVGGLPQHLAAAFPERHLGLFAADEQNVPAAQLEAWGALAAEWFELDAVLDIARAAPAVAPAALPLAAAAGTSQCRIGIARDEAFQFYYEYNLALLESLGAELVRFSPVHDQTLPQVDGLYFGGGYPESAAGELSCNGAMRSAVRAFALSGRPVYAECGGLMYLVERIRMSDGTAFEMAGVLPGEAQMHDRLQALGYVEVETCAESILGTSGSRFRGHQFRYSTLDRPSLAQEVARVYRVIPRWGGEQFAEGYSVGSVLATYVHAHWASNPAIAQHLVAACSASHRPSGAN